MKKNYLRFVGSCFCGAAFLLLTGCGTVVRSDKHPALIPQPVTMSIGEQNFKIQPSTPVVLVGSGFDAGEITCVTEALDAIFEPVFGRKFEVRHAETRADRSINIVCDSQLGREAYRLKVGASGVDIEAGGAAGAFYAVQSLRQLLPLALWNEKQVAGVELREMNIEDAPVLSYRGVMLDVARHFFTVEEVKDMLDILALHKMNTFHWHLTDDQGWRIEIKQYPRLTEFGSMRKRTLIGPDPGGHYDENTRYDENPYGGSYTQEQIRDVVEYARKRFITVIPEIEFPGHAVGALASYPWLGCTGEQYDVRQTWDIDDRVYCIGKESTFEFIEKVLGEVVELFPSEYIHIGGDECPMKMWEKCPACKARLKQIGETNFRRLQSYGNARLERFLNTHGRKMIGWDEILEGGVTPTAAVMSWRGSAGGVKAAQMGNYAVMSPSDHCYFDHYQSEDREHEPLAWGGFLPVSKVYAFNPYEGLNERERHFIMGVQANVWSEYIADYRQVQYMLLPRLSAMSEVGWSLDRKNYESYLERMPRMFALYDAMGYNYARHLLKDLQ